MKFPFIFAGFLHFSNSRIFAFLCGWMGKGFPPPLPRTVSCCFAASTEQNELACLFCEPTFSLQNSFSNSCLQSQHKLGRFLQISVSSSPETKAVPLFWRGAEVSESVHSTPLKHLPIWCSMWNAKCPQVSRGAIKSVCKQQTHSIVAGIPIGSNPLRSLPSSFHWSVILLETLFQWDLLPRTAILCKHERWCWLSLENYHPNSRFASSPFFDTETFAWVKFPIVTEVEVKHLIKGARFSLLGLRITLESSQFYKVASYELTFWSYVRVWLQRGDGFRGVASRPGKEYSDNLSPS